MNFKLIDVCFQNTSAYSGTDADFYIEMDDWNDYNYFTTYHLHATKKLTNTENVYLGSISILKKGQKEGDSRLLANAIKKGILSNPFEKLPDNYCSISFSLDLYRGLYKFLDNRRRQKIVRSLRMILSDRDRLYEEFKDEPGFEKSLLRSASMDSYILQKGKCLLQSDGKFHDWEHDKLKVNFNYLNQEITLNFSGVKNAGDRNYLPSGIIAFIGHNGCGKSTALYQLAKVLFTAPNDRGLLKNVLSLEPNNIGIDKLMMFSYSAFDNFVMPGVTLSDYRLMYEGMKDNSGRFIFCGLRDVRQEINEAIEDHIKKRGEDNKDNKIVDINQVRIEKIKTKTVDELSGEFAVALRAVLEDSDKWQIFEQIRNDSKVVLPSLYEAMEWIDYFTTTDENKEKFLSLSTGVKFFLHALVHLIAYMEDNSIVLFDEPENHLHPPFLSFMMSEFRRIIHNKHSVMLVATHSPVILQETLSKNVFIMERRDGETIIRHPETEIYGESFGLINSMVFRLNSDLTHYNDVMDELYEQWHCDDLNSIEQVLTRFKHRFGCEDLSSHMTAYLISKFESRDSLEEE